MYRTWHYTQDCHSDHLQTSVAGFPSDIQPQPLVLYNLYALQDTNIPSVAYKSTFH